jgi:hypothetical protein
VDLVACILIQRIVQAFGKKINKLINIHMSNYSNKPRTLEEAYLSIKKSSYLEPKTVSTSPVKEIAPGLKVNTLQSEVDPDSEDLDDAHCDNCGESDCKCEHESGDTTGQAVAMGVLDHPEHGMEGDSRFSADDEDEEDDITVDNIHSIKESLMKIAMAVSAGVHLEPWQQFKLAVVMDNLSSVARSLPRQSKCM